MAADSLGILFITVPIWHAGEPPNEVGQKARKEHKYYYDRILVSVTPVMNLLVTGSPCFLYLVVFAPPGRTGRVGRMR
jgi:hypothetical protein